MPRWTVDDIADTCCELHRQDLLDCLYLDNTVGETALTDLGIYFMENRFKNGIKTFLSHLETIRSILPW